MGLFCRPSATHSSPMRSYRHRRYALRISAEGHRSSGHSATPKHRQYQKRGGNVRTKTGRTLHETGRVLPVLAGDIQAAEVYPTALARVLRSKLGGRRAAAKTVMGWTGASERTVKSWFGGITAPSSEHLIALARYSDDVFVLLLRLMKRDHVDAQINLRVRQESTALSDRLFGLIV